MNNAELNEAIEKLDPEDAAIIRHSQLIFGLVSKLRRATDPVVRDQIRQDLRAELDKVEDPPK